MIKIIDWETESLEVRALRREVFIEEQGVSEQDEWDENDRLAVHFVIKLNIGDPPIAYARLLSSGQLGRMAVKKAFRHLGYGAKLVKYIVSYSQQLKDVEVVFLHAQMQALDFYRNLGFVPYGASFEEAGILHQAMRYET